MLPRAREDSTGVRVIIPSSSFCASRTSSSVTGRLSGVFTNLFSFGKFSFGARGSLAARSPCSMTGVLAVAGAPQAGVLNGVVLAGAGRARRKRTARGSEYLIMFPRSARNIPNRRICYGQDGNREQGSGNARKVGTGRDGEDNGHRV